MTWRKTFQGVLLGLLPAAMLLAACVVAPDSSEQDPIDMVPSKTPLTANVDSSSVETGLETELTPSEPGQGGTSEVSEEEEWPAIDLSDPGLSYQSMTLADESVLEFALLLPEAFDPALSYPVLLALPPGGQSRDMVGAGLSSYWIPGAAGRDWIVVSPIAPGGVLFYSGSEKLLPEFLEAMGRQILVEGDKYHLAGISNGGISAFRIAIQEPDLFHSMVVLPGFPADQDFSNLDRLIEMPLTMFVGEFDNEWIQEMSETQRELERLQVNSTLEIIDGNGHFINGVTGEQVFDLLDNYR